MKKLLLGACVAIVMLATSCSSVESVEVTSSWKEPNKEVTVSNLNKVLVVAMFKKEANSHAAENQMVAYLGGKGIAGYNYLDKNSNLKNQDSLKEKMRADGFDGAVTMRLVDKDSGISYIPGSIVSYPAYYGTFAGYYYNNNEYSPAISEYPGIKTYSVEINVYSIKENKIIWTGLTESIDPGGVQKMTEKIVKTVYNKMVDEGFITK